MLYPPELPGYIKERSAGQKIRQDELRVKRQPSNRLRLGVIRNLEMLSLVPGLCPWQNPITSVAADCVPAREGTNDGTQAEDSGG